MHPLPPLLPLPPEHIHVWLVFPHAIHNDTLLTQYRNLLNTQEQQKEKRFYFQKDQHRYLLTRALVRTVLSQYVPVAPTDWVFSRNQYGKPAIDAQHGLEHLSFNLSHSQRLIALAITRHSALGIDTENTQARKTPLNLINDYFSPAEMATMNATHPEQKSHRFFQHWTLKEAYVKARGMGLTIPLQHVDFQIETPNGITLTLHPDLNDNASNWNLWQLQPTAHDILSICAHTHGPEKQQLILREWPILPQR